MSLNKSRSYPPSGNSTIPSIGSAPSEQLAPPSKLSASSGSGLVAKLVCWNLSYSGSFFVSFCFLFDSEIMRGFEGAFTGIFLESDIWLIEAVLG